MKIIEIALRRLQWELDSGREDEIIEDLQREIDYRLWCDRCDLLTRVARNEAVTVRERFQVSNSSTND